MSFATKRQPSHRTRCKTVNPDETTEKHDAHDVVARPETDASPCPICQEPVGRPTLEGVTESWSRLPCGHRFGSHCIKLWLRMVLDSEHRERPVCPVCRSSASHTCGHPVLPVDATLHDGWEWGAEDQDDDGSGGGKWRSGREDSMVAWERDSMVARCTLCPFCLVVFGVPWTARRRRRKLSPLKLAKGCWRVIRHGRWAWELDDTRLVWVDPGEHEAAWQQWWQMQEPQGY